MLKLTEKQSSTLSSRDPWQLRKHRAAWSGKGRESQWGQGSATEREIAIEGGGRKGEGESEG